MEKSQHGVLRLITKTKKVLRQASSSHDQSSSFRPKCAVLGALAVVKKKVFINFPSIINIQK